MRARVFLRVSLRVLSHTLTGVVFLLASLIKQVDRQIKNVLRVTALTPD